MTRSEQLIDTFIEVSLKSEADFLKIKETLTRIGVPSRKEKKLFQSCHILHKKGKYYIVHFKELFKLDGNPTTIPDEDIARRNTIALLLEEWGLLDILEPEDENYEDNQVPVSHIKIVRYKEKEEWELIPKYQIGTRH